jgi:hypothetical protein
MEPQLLLAIPRTVVSGGDDARIHVQCNTPIKPRYLVVPRSISRSFEIVDIKVGGNSHLHSRGEIPAEVFAGDVEALGASETEEDFLKKTKLDQPVPLAIDDCPANIFITIEVRNISPCAENFSAVLFGSHPQDHTTPIKIEDLAKENERLRAGLREVAAMGEPFNRQSVRAREILLNDKSP